MKHHFINIINNTLNDNKISECLTNIEVIKNFSYMVVSNTEKPIEKLYNNHVDINESLRCVRNFFYSIDKNFGSMYENILQEKNMYNGIKTTSVKFFHLPKKFIDFNRSSLRNDGSVIIDYSELLYDIYVIAHEITHKFSFQKEHRSKINDLLCEVPSITMGLLLEDYLLKNTKYNTDEILINRNNELYELYNNSIKYIYEYIVLELYDRKGYVSRNLVEDYIKHEYSEISDKLLAEEETLNYLKQENKLGFYKRQRYILGMLLAINIKKVYNDKYSELINLIKILGNTDININEDIERLNTLDLTKIKDKIYINSSYEFLDDLESNYKNYLKEDKIKVLGR
ncbi:MAG: hypothetical protein ILA19_05170 [Bacilli bacterium]|nr:hypothetical protein [Bacilli bacterium]